MDRTDFGHENDSASSRTERVSLLIIGALLLIAGFGLATVAGPPRLPPVLPGTVSLSHILTGTALPLDGLAVALLDIAWVAWAWTILSTALEALVLAAELVASGHGWVRALRHVVDRLSVPLVRRAMTAAFAMQVIGRTVTVAAAEPLPVAEPIVLASSPQAAERDAGGAEATSSSTPTYVVRPGDTLWSIAEKAYGSGLHYRRLVGANVGRPMPNNHVFSAQGVIQPGWTLLAPGATWATDDADGQRWYTVQRGDTLSSIADMVFGDSARWHELFDLNRGATSADGLHTFEEPNTIWPGLRLQLTAPQPVQSEPDPPGKQEPDAPLTELLAASAAPAVGQDAPSISADQVVAVTSPNDAPPHDPVPRASLVRTPHALEPVMLDPSDAPPADPESMAQDAGPSPAAGAEVSTPTAPVTQSVPVLPLAAAGLGLAAVAGLAFGARRLRRLRPLPHEPESEVVVQGGFAEAQLAHDLTRGLHGVGFDPLAALVAQLELFLNEYNLSGVEVVATRHGRSSTTISLRCGLAEQPLLLDLATAFAEQLDADVEACVSADQDVVLRLVRLRKTRLLPTADSVDIGACLVPVGVLYDRQMYAVALRSLGHVLIVSLPGHGADTILASLVATLTARRSPEQLHVWTIGSPRSLPAPLFELPHLVRVVDPSDTDALSRAASQLRDELDWRANQELPVPDLLVVVPELASLGEHAARLALLAGRAADLGVRLAVASSDPEDAVGNPLTPCFTTRMVLRMQTEEASVALLGVADAAFLAGGGRLLLRVDGREAVELYGYRVAAEHLERLVKVMRSGYPAPRVAPEPPDGQPPPLPQGEREPEPPSDGATQVDVAPAGSQAAVAVDGTPLPVPPPEPQCGTESAAPVVDPPTASAVPAETATERAPQLDAAAAAAAIQIRCFGTPCVICRGERVWPRGGGGEAKPFELLLFLACQPADGATRDAVIQALWPEPAAMAEDANHRFRQLRYRLRRRLQQVPDAPSSDGVCMDRRGFRLDPDVVYSDAQEFLRLVHDARLHLNPTAPEVIKDLERARALYVGDLLDGPDARRYAWVDERDDSGVTLREHFRRLIQNACIRLAEAYTSGGHLAEAIEVYHDLTEMDPSDERLFQALFRLRAQSGDLRGLEAEECRMRQLLHELSADLETTDSRADEPDQETMQEFQRLHAELRAQEREPTPV